MRPEIELPGSTVSASDDDAGIKETGGETVFEKTSLLKSIIESPHGVVIFSLDSGYRYTEFSTAHREVMKKLWGVKIEVGMNMLDVISHPADREKAKNNFDRALQGEHLVSVEDYGDPLLHRTFYENRYSPIAGSDGAVSGLAVFVIDITERVLAEERLREVNEELRGSTRRAEELAIKAEAANQAKTDFLALMSHELRTPLNGVLGFAEILSFTELSDLQRFYAQKITESGDKLLSVISDILDFSSMEKGQVLFLIAPVVVEELLKSACLAARQAAADKGLAFRCEVDPCLPGQIAGDARWICQILANILGNAVKFTKAGFVRLRVETSVTEARTVVKFSVEDTGIGMSDETLGILFRPFTQGNSTLSRPFQGAGLGLAISKRLAEGMGGSITVASAPGIGSTFTFHLPLASCPSDSLASSKPASGDQLASPDPEKVVLVVEDDSLNRLLVERHLSTLGYHTEFVANGSEAVDRFVPGKYFAILMDLRMPVMNGFAATKAIRDLESGSRVPIIAITANVRAGDHESCFAAGMDEFLAKPFKKSELASALSRFHSPQGQGQ